MEPWRTAIANSDATNIWIRGYDIASLMRGATFADLVFVLHQARLPTQRERGLMDAILVSVADHGAGAPSCAAARLAASGNRGSASAAIAAGLERSRREGMPIAEAADQAVAAALSAQRRVPGLGHRVHTKDPRVDVLFEMARDAGLAGDATAFVRGLEAALHARGKQVPINVDGALAAVLHELGFAPAAGTFIFIIGRVAGLTAEVAEEYAREEPMRIRVPVEYDGIAPRPVE